jgi:hypothetical protein
MNATNDASNNAQKNFDKALLEYNNKQTELIFATRKRLFKLERTQNTDCKILITLMGCLCVVMILMCLEFGGFTW